jgi:hypothetical protein
MLPPTYALVTDLFSPFSFFVKSNTDRGPHAITASKTPQQILATRAFLDLLPNFNRAVLESSLSKYLVGEAYKPQVCVVYFTNHDLLIYFYSINTVWTCIISLSPYRLRLACTEAC